MMFDFWIHLLKQSVADSEHPNLTVSSIQVTDAETIKEPISVSEVKDTRLAFSSSAGPDGVTVKNWNKVPDRCKCKLFSTWLIVGKVPNYILDSRTIFLAKKPNSISPADARPLSIASVVLKHYHKILAKRLGKQLFPILDPSQLGSTLWTELLRRLVN
ncbi:Retrovirus-related Pol polyprotein from type-1 retrotransposable element R2 [Araneus ventricosus]|uniref:Retrovirus-related Pol polyprotein from type-1 retrotransposable element R2 n=1 Tax=Araneus ventricosus TaxID=182803 RepID=A0A4Y2QWP1_ARAVE|nr:Retrovirus-related Pol polyprotein from type-1 retrotransposable element R2 [Araneus ventricosus]